MTIPSSVRTAVGLVEGDLVEVRAVGKKVVITPQLAIDRSKFSTADDEYTPAQRRVAMIARLAEARKGPSLRSFKTADSAINSSTKKSRNGKHLSGSHPAHENCFLDRAIEAAVDTPLNVRRALNKQLRFLAANIQYPSLHAKKFDESSDLWQARVNKAWRFYFTIAGDPYRIEDVIPHPK